MSQQGYARTFILCSRGMLYQNLVAGYDGEVTVRPLTTREEKLLAGSQTSQQSLIDQVLGKVCDLPDGLPSDEVLTVDRLHILLIVRLLSYGSDYAFQLACENCRAKIGGRKDLSQVDVHYAEEMVKIGYDDTLDDDGSLVSPQEVPFEEPFTVRLPIRDVDLQWRLLRRKDTTQIAKHVQKLAQRGLVRPEAGDPAYNYRLACHIASIDGKSYPFNDLVRMLDGDYLIGADSLAVRNAIDGLQVGPDLRVEQDCPHCGWLNEGILPMNVQEFFRPRRYRSSGGGHPGGTIFVGGEDEPVNTGDRPDAGVREEVVSGEPDPPDGAGSGGPSGMDPEL